MIVNFNWRSIEFMVCLVYDCDYDCEYDSCERKNWFGVLFFLLHVIMFSDCIHQRILIQHKRKKNTSTNSGLSNTIPIWIAKPKMARRPILDHFWGEIEKNSSRDGAEIV